MGSLAGGGDEIDVLTEKVGGLEVKIAEILVKLENVRTRKGGDSETEETHPDPADPGKADEQGVGEPDMDGMSGGPDQTQRNETGFSAG